MAGALAPGAALATGSLAGASAAGVGLAPQGQGQLAAAAGPAHMASTKAPPIARRNIMARLYLARGPRHKVAAHPTGPPGSPGRAPPHLSPIGGAGAVC